MKKELNIFLTAVMFYTRIPCPPNTSYSADILNKATRYFPVIGWIVGGLVAGIYWGSALIFSESVSILLSMAFGIMVTGAFHEDGFADVCDGFGGGYTKEARLTIMKDSRIGTYGSVGLILILLLKFLLLVDLSIYNLVAILVVSHAVSRVIPIGVVFFGEYARDDLTSKVKPIGRKIGAGGFLFAIVFGFAPILLLNDIYFLLIVLLPVFVGVFLSRYFKKRIGGYTGDCLGTIQQVSEISVYLSVYLVYQYLV